MTQKQDSLYWREWAAARRAWPDADRHELHVQALGVDKSHKLFTNADFDKVLGAFRAVSNRSSLNAQVKQIQQPKTRLLRRIQDQIKVLGLFRERPAAYAKALLQDKFNTDWLEELSMEEIERESVASQNARELRPDREAVIIDDSELEMMRNTLARCISRFRRADPREFTEHEMYRAAGLPCVRKTCAQCRGSQPSTLNSQPTAEPALADNIPF